MNFCIKKIRTERKFWAKIKQKFINFSNDFKSAFFIKNLSKSQRYTAFTLAEVIIVIGIIGIVAEMTIPQLVLDAQDAQYKMGKDKVRMSIAEAGKILSVSGEISDATSAEDFVKNYLSKQLKIIKFCAPADKEKCGVPSGNPTTFKNLYNTNVASMPSTWSAITAAFGVTDSAPDDGDAPYDGANPTTQIFNNGYTFLTADGIAVNLFYNPYCAINFTDKMYKNSPDYTYTYIRPQLSLDTACMSGVYDMNGLKKPNQVGKDIGFFGVFYNGIQSTAVATLPYKEGFDGGYDWESADNYCRSIKGYKLPTVDELSALYLGRYITGMSNSVWLWSASGVPGSDFAQTVGFGTGRRNWGYRSNPAAFRCVRD